MRPIVRCLVALLFIHQMGCGRFEVMKNTVYYLRGKRDITFPGTKWCGPGSRAANFSDLGDESETDKCCREHDHCPESISGYSWKHGLHNPTPYTRSHCYCDEAFRRCLEDVKSKVGNLMAEIYFNFLKVKCFKQDCPIVRCIKYSGLI
uniref:Phospholipase A2 n=1 Tax=Strigamia maritima TaxID=126957 RepID=T1JK18_STRMM